ncbi:Dynein light chain type 1/2 [Penicillium verrucosum]|uniref:Dynein light chain type 1/2 n=1 Tax=Penicillium verrucosum TaxID=60171 RepID=UPI0025452386|nr:Dynein light chain type 1/2 [Penicillium verrucosum]KAJ5920223.1 Dynein light chain type 1/2 [Penicillium verrucosum]
MWALGQSRTTIADITCLFAKTAKPQRHTPNPAAFVFDRPSIPQIALISLLILFRNCVPTFPHLAITMAFCITFGTHEFSSQLEGYEHVRAYCYNCQHWNGHCVTRWPFFTICFIPLIPLAMHKYKEVQCYTCRYTQDLRDRPDITPDTRPPAGMQYGIQPPPQAQGGWQQQPPLQAPPQAQGGLGYK